DGHAERLLPNSEADNLKLLGHYENPPQLNYGKAQPWQTAQMRPAALFALRHDAMFHFCHRRYDLIPGRTGPWIPTSTAPSSPSALKKQPALSIRRRNAEPARASFPWSGPQLARLRPVLPRKN